MGDGGGHALAARMTLPTIVFVAPAALCALSWLGFGSLVPRRALPDDELLAFLTRVALGATAVSLLTFGLGRLHLYTREMLLTVTAAGAVLSIRAARPYLRLPRGRPDVRVSTAVVAVAFALVLDLVASSVPPTSVDGLKYHLALPRLWLEQGTIGDAFWSWVTFNPFGIEMLYGQALALAGSSCASAVGGMLAVLTAVALYGFTRYLSGSVAAGVAGAALFVLQGVFTWEATSTFVELGLCLYLVLGLWFALRFARAKVGADLVWAGAFAGATAGTKYVGLQAWLLALPLLAATVRARHVRALGAAGGAALLAGGGWYLKNLFVAHNPVYPVGGGELWTNASARAVDKLDQQYGVAGPVVRLVALPIDLLVHGGAFDRGQYVGTGIFVAAIVGLLLVRTREVVLLAGGAAAYLVSWWYLSPQARFLMPVLAVLAAIGGAGALRMAAVGRIPRFVVAGGALVVVIAWLAPSIALTRHSLPVAFGAQSPAAFVQEQTGTYDALRAAAARTDGVVALVGYPFLYYVPGRTLYLGEPEFALDVPTAVFRKRLRAEGVTFLLDADRSLSSYAQLRGCLEPVATYRARMVTSRSLGQSRPLTFRLYRLNGPCTRTT